MKIDQLPISADIEIDWQTWLKAVSPKVFTLNFAWFQSEYWQWAWSMLQRRKNGEKIIDTPLSALVMRGRGLSKSTDLEHTALAEGALINEAFGVYVSSTQDKANEHIAAIRDAIEGSEIARYYPGLSNPRVGKFGNQRGWRQEAVYTESGFAIVGVGLDKGIRGLKDINSRPTLIIMDDIDERDDSALVIEKKVKTITSDILPMAAPMAMVIFAQNLIHLNSVMNKCWKREIPLLSHRKEFGPVNTFQDDLRIEKRDTRKVIISGTANWERIDIDVAQKLLDDIGEDAFMSECQNDMTAGKDERVLSNYDETYHIITGSMFESVIGTRRIPSHWELHAGHDWGSTGPQAHPAVVSVCAVASEDSPQPGAAFIFYGKTFNAGISEHDVARTIISDLHRYAWHPGLKDAYDLLLKSDKSNTDSEMWELRQQAGELMPLLKFRVSHEQKDIRQTYRDKWGLPAEACDSGKTTGLSQLRHYLDLDPTKKHLFKQSLQGRPSVYFIVDDDQLFEAKNDRGLKRHRTEALTLKWDPNVAGRDVPTKRGDDAIDSLKMIFQGFPLAASPLNEKQRIEQKIDERLRLSTIEAGKVEKTEGWEMARTHAVAKAETDLLNEGRSEYDSFWSDTV